ncbi:MAG: hypothetical protein BMS9Abin37_0567 [Acidobacteriota bacterium]|nr:MAG: hypothetical protein BMS9Abin37_0567 [Acidobacteriota bacterium]
MSALRAVAERYLPPRYLPAARSVFHRSVRAIRSVIFYGSRFYCPLCDHRLRLFLPGGAHVPQLKHHKLVGLGFRAHRQCPVCLATDKERHQFLCISEQLAVFSGERIRLLHIAPEPNARRLLEASPRVDYFCGDLNSPQVDVRLDVRSIPYGDHTVDAILCSHVLEHIPEDREAVAELYRVLKPGGWAILQVPVSLSLEETMEEPRAQSEKEREMQFGQSDHVRLYGRDYLNRLSAAGFEVEPYNYATAHGITAAHRNGLIVDEDVYVCRKIV